jgi:hypothetical protein
MAFATSSRGLYDHGRAEREYWGGQQADHSELETDSNVIIALQLVAHR